MLYTSKDEENKRRKVDELLKALKDAYPREIPHITQELAHLRHSVCITVQKAVEPLIEKLHEERNYDDPREYETEFRVRFAIVEALGKIGDTRAIAPLIELTQKGYGMSLPEEPDFRNKGNETVCVAAIKAMREILKNVPFPEVKSRLERATEDSPLHQQLEAARKAAFKYLDQMKSMKKDAKAVKPDNRKNNRPSGPVLKRHC